MHEFHVVGYAGLKFLTNQLEVLFGDLKIVVSDGHLTARSLHVQHRTTDLGFNPAHRVLTLGRALSQRGIGHLNGAFRSPAKPERDAHERCRRERSVRFVRTRSVDAVVAIHRQRRQAFGLCRRSRQLCRPQLRVVGLEILTLFERCLERGTNIDRRR